MKLKLSKECPLVISLAGRIPEILNSHSYALYFLPTHIAAILIGVCKRFCKIKVDDYD